MKLYTRSGDDGSTGLFGGDRVEKDHVRVEAYGGVDETNACLGLCVVACTTDDGDAAARIATMLTAIQSRLFDLGADLATPADSPHTDKIHRFAEPEVAEIEGWIDEIDGQNTPMTAFVLPGGTELAAQLHVARTVCRRAERALVAARRSEDLNEAALRYLNRLSDLLFALARRANAGAGVADVPWRPMSADE